MTCGVWEWRALHFFLAKSMLGQNCDINECDPTVLSKYNVATRPPRCMPSPMHARWIQESQVTDHARAKENMNNNISCMEACKPPNVIF